MLNLWSCIEKSTETLPSEIEPSSSEGPPTKKKKPGPLSVNSWETFLPKKSHTRIPLIMLGISWYNILFYSITAL